MRPPRVEFRYVQSVCAALLFACVTCMAQTSLPGTVELSPMPLDRTQAVPSLAVLGLSSSVLSEGALAFQGGYDPADWSGVLQATTLHDDGETGDVVWDAGALLTQSAITAPAGRTILSASRNDIGVVAGMAFEPTAPFDASEKDGITWPNLDSDKLGERVDYLRGIRAHELDGSMRARGSLLGAIINAQTVYVGRPSGNYADVWPKTIRGQPVPAPEMEQGAQSYVQFVEQQAQRVPFLYVAANDGMLHAFHAPVPTCKKQGTDGRCIAFDSGADAGREGWAFVPRAAYGYLGNLARVQDFQFQPTVDATPVTRDVFFSQHGKHEWHTLLVGGMRLGGRGVYALDITQPTAASEAFPERTVLWEFDADAPAGTSMAGGDYNPADLGYTYGQPAIARLANGRWVVLVPNGYFADCNKPDKPLRCDEIAGTPPSYSALFVLDAQTGEVIAELKTPDGVTSHGLTTPVLGDYDNDQVDDVAFAGDLAGNVWRFDLFAPNPAQWKVTLAYLPSESGAQPITVMPRLFPDPATNRFIVVFGTGKYLSASDKIDTTMQAIYGIRDKQDAKGQPATITQDSLQTQILSETTIPDPSDSGGSTSLRNLTSNPVPMKAGGWQIELKLIPGERVVATPTALFDTNTALISTLIPNGDDPYGSILAIDAATGGPRSIVAFDGGSYAGALVEKPQLNGTLPVAMRLGGGKLILPGVTLKGGSGSLDMPLSLETPLWRRRSWTVLTPDT
jgi:Tfp pilus tip-associated adhesin PilY1